MPCQDRLPSIWTNGRITVNGSWPLVIGLTTQSDFALTEIAVVSLLMRHSLLDLTAKLYGSLGLRDWLGEVNKLPEFF